MSGPGLRIDRIGPVGWLTFNRPEVANAMDGPMMNALPDAWRELDEDAAVGCIVVTGAGRAFQTGLDMKALSAAPDTLREQARRTRMADPRLTALHLGVRTPVVAAVNGVCAGGGLHFVVDADIVVASRRARFLDPHVSVGQASAWEAVGLSVRCPAGVAARLVLLGSAETLDAERARQVGLVGEVVEPDDLIPHAQQVAESVAAAGCAGAVRKRALWSALETGRSEALLNTARGNTEGSADDGDQWS